MPDIKTIKVTNHQSPGFKEYHVDGALTGITPRGYLNINFFAERGDIPLDQEMNVESGVVISKDALVNVHREFAVGIFMDINVAKALIQVVTAKIKELELAQLTFKKE